MKRRRTARLVTCETRSSTDDRTEFLFHMYDQLFNDIDRHILVVWQSVGVLLGSFAILALTEKQIVDIDAATAGIVMIAGWSLAHQIDAAFWYNRNLVIIANIERQFLKRTDLRDVHHYFEHHRKDNKMITHLVLQVFLAGGVLGLVLLFHAVTRVLPGLGSPWRTFEPLRTLPYAVALVLLLLLRVLHKDKQTSYDKFVLKSPGTDIAA